MKILWFALGLTAAILPAERDAAAQSRPMCGVRADIMAQLKGAYNEKPAALGTTGDGAVVELMTSDRGTWTLMLSLPGGKSCLIATGEDWEQWPRLTGRDS